MHRPIGLLVVMSTFGLGCLSHNGVRPEPFPRLSTSPKTVTKSSTLNGDRLTTTALQLVGTPYRWGGDSPRGFDCSGFTRFVFAQHGISLPRLAKEQYRQGDSVGSEDLQPGDLVFFTTIAPGASHVGLAIGEDEFVHAPNERGEVRVERLSQRYWSRRYLGAKRVAER